MSCQKEVATDSFCVKFEAWSKDGVLGLDLSRHRGGLPGSQYVNPATQVLFKSFLAGYAEALMSVAEGKIEVGS